MHSIEGNYLLDPAQVMPQQANISNLLVDNGIKPTRQRVAIANHMFNKDQHLSADAILALVNKDTSTANVSKATVYNTLKLFVSKGILNEVAIDPQRILFDTNTHKHHHILNVDTGEIRDIEPLELDLSKVPELTNKKIDCVDLVIKVRQ